MESTEIIKSKIVSNDVFLGSIIDLLKMKKLVEFNISGSSMEPFLFHENSVVLKHITATDIKLGMVVLGRSNGAYFLHRVVKIESNCIHMAGDNNLSQIEIIDTNQIFGVAIEVIRDNVSLSLISFNSRLKGLIWYYLRPLRRVFVKLSKL